MWWVTVAGTEPNISSSALRVNSHGGQRVQILTKFWALLSHSLLTSPRWGPTCISNAACPNPASSFVTNYICREISNLTYQHNPLRSLDIIPTPLLPCNPSTPQPQVLQMPVLEVMTTWSEKAIGTVHGLLESHPSLNLAQPPTGCRTLGRTLGKTLHLSELPLPHYQTPLKLGLLSYHRAVAKFKLRPFTLKEMWRARFCTVLVSSGQQQPPW